MMKPSRSLLLVVSTGVVLLLLAGGLAVKVGAGENSYRQAVLFAEVLSIVLDNYVDPVETENLLEGAYEGLLSGLDPNGAYLTPEEVREWKAPHAADAVDPGISVLKTGRMVQVIAVDPGSSAAEAAIEIGDQLRSIDGRDLRDLSLNQVRRLLEGPGGSAVQLSLVRPQDGFRRDEVELVRAARRGRAYELELRSGIGVLVVRDLRRLRPEALAQELDDVRSRGVERLLLDLRNVADGGPRDAAGLVGLFAPGTSLKRRDRSGEVVESLSSPGEAPAWDGPLSLLVNAATAGSGEAVVQLIQLGREATVFGETTFGLGAEPELVELDNGAALLISATQWETETGRSWNGEGITPDETVRGSGSDFEEVAADQLNQVLERLDPANHAPPPRST